MLGRWTALRDQLENGQPWTRDQKKKALLLLGNRPVGVERFGPADPLRWYADPEQPVDEPKREEPAKKAEPCDTQPFPVRPRPPVDPRIKKP